MAKVNMKEIDLSQFMLDEATLEENITSAGDYYDYDGRETIDDLNDLGMDIY